MRVDGEAAFYEIPRGERDAAPVFERGETVVCDEDGLHFFEVGVAVERGVAAEEKVGYDAYGPNVAVLVAIGVSVGEFFLGKGGWVAYTGLPWPVFLKISGAM